EILTLSPKYESGMGRFRPPLAGTTRSQGTTTTGTWRSRVPGSIPIIARVGMEVLPSSAANAIVFSFVLKSRRTSRVPAAIPIPERDVGLNSRFFQRLDDLRGAISAVSNCLINGQLVPISHPLDLRQIRLVVLSCSGRDLR